MLSVSAGTTTLNWPGDINAMVGDGCCLREDLDTSVIKHFGI